MNKTKLNLGCGRDILPEYVNADISGAEGIDVCCDFEKDLPFEDNTFEEVLVYHVAEHIKNFDNFIQEIWRISKPGALVKIRAPYYRNKNAFDDPHHVRFFTEDTFNYWIEERKDELSYELKTRVNFSVEKTRLIFPPSIFSLIWHLIPLEAWHNLWGFMVTEIRYSLRVEK